MATFESVYSQTIHTGDLIVVACGKLLDVGIFLGPGKGNSMQYHSIRRIHYWIEKTREGMKMEFPSKDYVVRMYVNQVMKISPDMFNNEFLEMYKQSMQTLKERKLI